MRIINQIIAPDSGSLIFDGNKLKREDIAKIGYLPEERGLYKKMKVGEQALYLAKLKGMSHKEAMEKLKYWFEKLEILHWWNKKVEELKLLENTIQKLMKTHDDQQDIQMQSLVKIYENMKPKDAARIFEALDMTTLLSVAELMNERKLAPIMAKMDPNKAKDMTVQLSRLRKLPQSGIPTGG